jgi:hypothetical protein
VALAETITTIISATAGVVCAIPVVIKLIKKR